MAIREWWAGDASERFWLEITNRTDLGRNLIAPQRNDRGLEEWSYELVRYVRPGDIVLHWSKVGESSLVAYSHVSGDPHASDLTWQSRGSYGRQRPPSGLEPAWEAPLEGFTHLDRPVPLSRLRDVEASIQHVREELQGSHGAPLYFPFALSEKRPLRAAQSYLTKIPAGIIALLPELIEIRQLAVEEPGQDVAHAQGGTGTAKASRATGYGRLRDATRRRAIERYAVAEVIAHFQAAGWQCADVGDSRSWDLTVTKGEKELHVEVKGSTTVREAIDITEGEVRHAEDIDTLLVVIDQISVDDGNSCSGGRWRSWSSWRPARADLIATAYRHPLPAAPDGKPAV